uniref:Envelope glycoprotein n=1 Tax=Myotis myotis TaxID=51298 RepID=A0A7J7YDV8_MYOMY|nr:hypothetical protein mMyoMyo1_011124 [Myotis myotis]
MNPATCVYPRNYPLSSSVYTGLCNSSIVLPKNYTGETPTYLVAPEGTWWACTTGITPCIFSPALQHPTNPGLCILTHILPQVYYYSGEGGREHLNLEPKRVRRAPILVPLLMGIGLAGSTAVGTAALATGHQNYKELSKQIDKDLSTLEKSVSQLEDSLSSLAEVVLQNRRGLDLLFLKQGGLCLALRETCCFYTNHSGVIRESLSQLRKRLADREEARRAEGNWYENLFSWSPWLTTLLSALAGPVIILLLGLIFGPCIARCLLNFIQSRIQVVKLMVLHTQYTRILKERAESKI